MSGEPVLILRDLHVAPSHQRKGLGRHLCQLLELVARKNAMHGGASLCSHSVPASRCTRTHSPHPPPCLAARSLFSSVAALIRLCRLLRYFARNLT